jgi:hypothetical protein
MAILVFSAILAQGARADDLKYRQSEFVNQWKYLSSKEVKVAEELNDEISRYNENPSMVAMQRIEDLKIKVIENLQDQIKNDRDYIAYLELRLSEFSESGFTPLLLEKDLKSAPKSAEEAFPVGLGENLDSEGEEAEELMGEITRNLEDFKGRR